MLTGYSLNGNFFPYAGQIPLQQDGRAGREQRMQFSTKKTAARNPPASTEELELVTRIAQRDRTAMKQLYFIYHKRLSRFLLRIVHRRDLVEEIINDTMFAVWRKAAGFRGDSQVSTWILGIAYRQALKGLKRYRTGSLRDAASASLNASEPIHDAGAEQRELQQWLDQGLGRLPPVQRLVIELAYFMGHSCEEIALITSCPVNTVKTRMFHARERLRVVLGEFESGSGTPSFPAAPQSQS